MKIGLDARMIGHSGIGVTIRYLLENLSAEQLKQVTLFTRPDWENPYATAHTIPVPYTIYSAKHHLLYPFLIKKQKVDLYHMPHFDVPYLYRRPFVATVHDIITYLFPQYSTKPFTRAYSRVALQHTTAHARCLIVDSESTKKDLLLNFPLSENKMQIVYPAVDRLFSPVSPDKIKPVLEKYNLRAGYFLYVGNLRASKNTPRLINAYADLKKRHPDAPPLVLVGKTFLKDLGAVPNDVFHIDGAKTDELPALYSGAAVFVFPSLYEGFGLPPLEAMACGTPVLTSNVASLPEVCGNAAHYVDPLSESEIADGMWSLITTPSKRDEMKKKGLENVKRFSWKRFATSTWQVYKEALADS